MHTALTSGVRRASGQRSACAQAAVYTAAAFWVAMLTASHKDTRWEFVPLHGPARESGLRSGGSIKSERQCRSRADLETP